MDDFLQPAGGEDFLSAALMQANQQMLCRLAPDNR